jgi:hypothetical protein
MDGRDAVFDAPDIQARVIEVDLRPLQVDEFGGTRTVPSGPWSYRGDRLDWPSPPSSGPRPRPVSDARPTLVVGTPEGAL